MKKLKVAEIIIKVLESRYPSWIFSYELINKATPFGWLGSSSDRIARRLAEAELIDRIGREQHSFYAKYRAKPIKPVTEIIPNIAVRQMDFNS